ncbi:hypothetical protein FM114_04665 [Luteococcus japonicus LSP_Lj1]|uniref:Fic/DOC N-terminal domain-containing protein n=1 Tax=Luteococcus japonicus LSP_Lj1 TaxID=1255658 RepID=A0A1R4J123_9ACTN|nr:hypothetical protein FM114_04665 [Luteococcus japonicus LSP_Lj1]
MLKATISASRALARLDGAYKRLPDPTMLINLISHGGAGIERDR